MSTLVFPTGAVLPSKMVWIARRSSILIGLHWGGHALFSCTRSRLFQLSCIVHWEISLTCIVHRARRTLCTQYLPSRAPCTGVLFKHHSVIRAPCMAICMLVHTCTDPPCLPYIYIMHRPAAVSVGSVPFSLLFCQIQKLFTSIFGRIGKFGEKSRLCPKFHAQSTKLTKLTKVSSRDRRG